MFPDVKLPPFESHLYSPEYLEHHPPYGKEYGEDVPYRTLQYRNIFGLVEPHRLTCPILGDWEERWVKYLKVRVVPLNLPTQPFIQWFLVKLSALPPAARVKELDLVIDDIKLELESQRRQARDKAITSIQKTIDGLLKKLTTLRPSPLPVPPPVVPVPSGAPQEVVPVEPPTSLPPPAVTVPLVLLPSPEATPEEPPPPSAVPPPAVPPPLVLLPSPEAASETPPPMTLVPPPAVVAPLATSPLPKRLFLLGANTEHSLAVPVTVDLPLAPPEPDLQTDVTFWRVPAGVPPRWSRLVWDPGSGSGIARHHLLGLHHQLLNPKIHRGELTDSDLRRCSSVFSRTRGRVL